VETGGDAVAAAGQGAKLRLEDGMAMDRHPLLKVFDVQSVFFIPVWRRIALVAFCGFWAIFEWVNGGPYWAAFFTVIAVYCAHQFFVAFDPPEDKS